MLGQSKQHDQILANSTQSWRIRGGGRDVVTSQYLLTSHEKSQRRNEFDFRTALHAAAYGGQ